jgi:hypothetical protein
VRKDWKDVKHVVSARDGIFYVVEADGTLAWLALRVHGRKRNLVATHAGWYRVGQLHQSVRGEDGVIYGVQPDGTLLPYVHLGHLEGSSQWIGEKQVGTGWQNFTTVLMS